MGDCTERGSLALKLARPIEVLRELIDSNGLKQKDLLDIFGTPSIVSEVLREKRGLTVEHIRRLSQRFHVSPGVFFSGTFRLSPNSPTKKIGS